MAASAFARFDRPAVSPYMRKQPHAVYERKMAIRVRTPLSSTAIETQQYRIFVGKGRSYIALSTAFAAELTSDAAPRTVLHAAMVKEPAIRAKVVILRNIITLLSNKRKAGTAMIVSKMRLSQ